MPALAVPSAHENVVEIDRRESPALPSRAPEVLARVHPDHFVHRDREVMTGRTGRLLNQRPVDHIIDWLRNVSGQEGRLYCMVDRDDLLRECTAQKERGMSANESVAFLKSRSASIVDSIAVISKAYNIGLADAKKLVVLNPLWSDEVRNAEPLHDAAEKYLRERAKQSRRKRSGLVIDKYLEAAGPMSSGYDVAVIPRSPSTATLRQLVKDIMHERGINVGSSPEEIGIPRERDGYGDVMKTLFWSKKSFGLIVSPDRWDHDTTRLLSLNLDSPVLLVGNAFDRLWWYFLYVKGHLVDRHCSSPGINEQEAGDPEFEEMARELGRDQALKAYMEGWHGRAELVAEHFHADRAVVETYLRQFTVAELDDLDQDEDGFCALKAYADDRFSLASQWLYFHFLERLGVDDMSSDYWNLLDRKVPYSAPPLYTLALVGPLEMDPSTPPCAQNPYGGFYRDHAVECPYGQETQPA